MSEHNHHHHETEPPEETKALLSYMLHHNRHHSEELLEIAGRVGDEEARALLHRAVDSLGESNRLLAEALERLKEGE